jgi:hypothetical protein
MDAEQNYIEEAEFIYEDIAYDKILKMGGLGYNLSMVIHNNASKFKKSNSVVQKYAAIVSDNGVDTPFEMLIYNEDSDLPILIDVRPIDTDSYLDFLNQNKSITHEIKDNN